EEITPNPSSSNPAASPSRKDFKDIAVLSRKIFSETRKVVIGKEDVLEKIYVGLIAGGHILLEGFPGVAKTHMAKNFAKTLGCTFHRIQFTPDLLPSDIVGTTIFDQKKGEFQVRLGPIFANVILADEINRAPPKTQSALLEAMSEKGISIEGTTHQLPQPFMVLATQNPIELEGTYPLPEAQLDRFLLKLIVDYPSEREEIDMIHYKNKPTDESLKTVATPKGIGEIQQKARHMLIDDKIIEYIGRIIQRTRKHPQILIGGSPRASIALLTCAKTVAAIQGRDYVIPDDVKRFTFEVLNHRLILKPEAELEGVTPEVIINRIVKETDAPK
ncbi:MAG: AAA family ATPase, partial [Candidatus Ranarchaeia archaeon]